MSTFVAVDPRTSLHLRPATEVEAAAYLTQSISHPSAHASFRRPLRVGEVMIDEDTGPGIWFGGAGF